MTRKGAPQGVPATLKTILKVAVTGARHMVYHRANAN